MDAIELDQESRKAAAEVEAIHREHDEIMALVEGRLRENRKKRDEAYERLTSRRGELFQSVTHEDLCDPLKFQVISELAWNSGLGLPRELTSKHVKEVLFPETYVLDFLSFYGNESVLTFTAAIPKNAHPEKLAHTAELLAPVLKAATENSNSARIEILEDDCGYYENYHIVWDEEEKLFMLQGKYYESEDLLEVLKRVPTYR